MYHDAGEAFVTDRALGADDYRYAQERLEARASMTAATAHVESLQQPFSEAGDPIARIEKHVWNRHAFNDRARKEIGAIKVLNPADQAKRWENFNYLFSVDPLAAVKSTSFGAFQIMGFNHAACGFEDPLAFLDGMQAGAGAQTLAFCRFIEASPALHGAMKRRDFPTYARHYNGKGYERNKYDIKIRTAERRFANVLLA